MNEFLINIILTVLIVSLISLIIPENKMGNFIRCLMPFIILLVIIKPLISFDVSKITDKFNIFDSNYSVSVQKDFIDDVNNSKATKMEQYIEKLLFSYGISNSKVTINFIEDFNNIICINEIILDLKNAVIISENKHIDINEIKNIISNYCQVSISVVKIIE